jgi:hypothetical protein
MGGLLATNKMFTNSERVGNQAMMELFITNRN